MDDVTAPTVGTRRRVPARDLSRNTAKLLDAVLDGEVFVVTRAGKSVALLMPIEEADLALESVILAGVVDPSILDAGRAQELEDALAEIEAVNELDPANTATNALLAMRDEEADR